MEPVFSNDEALEEEIFPKESDMAPEPAQEPAPALVQEPVPAQEPVPSFEPVLAQEPLHAPSFEPVPAIEPLPEPAFAPVNGSCPPPTKPFTDVNPHSNPKIEYAFYTKDSIHYNAKGEIDLEGAVNVFLNPTKGDPGIFTVKSGSVADVTSSIGDVIIKICDTIQPGPKQKDLATLQKKLPGLKNLLNIGRENVDPAYEFMYNTFVTGLMDINDNNGYMTKDAIKSYFIGPSAIKALLDSGPLGEGVLSAIDNNLCPCFEPLAVNLVDIEDYLKIYESLERGATWSAPKTDIIHFLDFWVTLEYCRVFQLVSSDVLGAVNGFIPLRAIIENTGFTGFITIPKGSGGELGVDNKICVYALFLNNVLKGEKQNFFKIPDNSTEKGKYEVLRQQYQILYKEFRDLLDTTTELLNVNNITSNAAIIKISVNTLMQLLEANPNGTVQGTSDVKSSKFPATYNTYKIITLLAGFIETHADFFQKAINGLNNSYTADVLNVENSAWITWLCFQLARYQQTQKVYKTPINTPPDSDARAILSAFEQRKQLYCTSVKNSRAPFQTAWYKATQQVYINEAFAGHDNKSYELTKAAIQVFGGKKSSASRRQKADMSMELDADDYEEGQAQGQAQAQVEGQAQAQATVEKFDVAWLDKFVQPNKKNPETGVYSEHPEDVIIKVLRETNCTCFLEAFYIPDNIDIWTVGETGAGMLNEREYDKKKHKLPIHKPTNGLLDIITGPKQGQHSTFIVVDLAKYVPDAISKNRSVDEIKRIFSLNNDSFDAAEIEHLVAAYQTSDSDVTEKNEAAIDLFFRNKLIEQDMLKNFNTGVVYAPIIYSVDAASFKLPSNAVFLTGALNIPIDVGNNIMMVITFKVGTDDTYTKGLYTRPVAPINPLLLREIPEDKKDYAICLEYFYKKKNTVTMNKELNTLLKPEKSKKKSTVGQSIGKFSFEFKNEDGTPATINMQGNYATFLKTLFANVGPGNNNYQLYLEAVIPNIESLKSADIFTDKSSVGRLWKKLIYNIAEDDVYVAQAFMRTLTASLEIYTEGKKTAIDDCAREINDFITLIKQIQLHYMSDSRTTTLTSAQLQQAMTAKGITFCICRPDKGGNIVFELATFEEVIERFPVEMQALEAAARGAQALSELPTYNEADQEQPQQQQTDMDTEMAGENAFIEFALKRKTEEDTRRSKKNTKEYYESQIAIMEKQLEQNNSGYLNALNEEDTIEQEFYLHQHRLFVDKLNKYKAALATTTGGGQIGGDTTDAEIEQIDNELAELERTHEKYLLSQVKFTDEPLSELELAKTAAFLGPELYDNIALREQQEATQRYTKVFAQNASNVPLGVPVDVVLPEGTTTADFYNTLVTVKRGEEGQYYIERADAFLNAPQSATQNAVAKVEEVVEMALENVVEKVEDFASSAKEAITSLSTPKVGADEYGPEYAPTIAAPAAGGSKKSLKNQRKRIKKVTKRKQGGKKIKIMTKRKRGGKKPKKTKRRN